MAFFLGVPSDVHSKVRNQPTAIPKIHRDKEAVVLSDTNSEDGSSKSILEPGLVLQFDGYFKERVPESPDERVRYRRVGIFYYHDDATWMLREPKIDNSGLEGGIIIRRQRVPKPDKTGHFTIKDVAVPGTICLYGRDYRIVKCSQLAVKVLAHYDISVGEFETVPKDKYAEKHSVENNQPKLRKGKTERVKRVNLEDIGKVLRFYATWEDTESEFEDIRGFVIHWYLDNDTCEVREIRTANDGLGDSSLFMIRQKLPRKFGISSDLTQDIYQDLMDCTDFVCGEEVVIMGRRFYLYDCDNSTREFYKERYGVFQRKFEPPAVDDDWIQYQQEDLSLPPATGFGGDEDSLSCWRSLVPKPPKRDQHKLIMNEGKVMRFGGRLLADSPIDRERKFVLSYFLADDTISVFEPPQRNSGISGGSFLRRSRVKVPDAEPTIPPLYYKASDFAIGKIIVIHKRKFTLVDADDYALHYMELHPEDFPDSDIGKVHDELKKIVESKGMTVRDVFEAVDKNDDGTVDGVEFKQMMADNGLNPQAALTLFRRYDLNNDGKISLKEFMAAIDV